MALYVGDDWSEDHHDVHLMNEAGERLAARRLPEGVEGVTALHELVAEHASGPGEVSVGIETDHGPWVSALVAAGYHVYAVNPRSAARYRLVWDRNRQTNRLRNALREYFPGALRAFPSLVHGDAVGVLATAPGPREAARLSTSQIRSALRRGGRQRNVEQRAAELRQAFRAEQLEMPAAVSEAFAATTRAAVGQIAEISRQIADLEVAMESSLEQHPDADIYRSMPGLGVVLGARVLGEFGDDPERYESAKSRRNYAGTSPLTVASGRKRTVRMRYIRNRRLGDATMLWAMCSLRASPGCRDFYDRRRAAGDLHYQALRALANRLVGYLHGCLRARTPYDEHVAWDHRHHLQSAAA